MPKCLSPPVSVSGAVAYKTTPLISAAEVDRAVKKRVAYRPPKA